MLYRIFLVVVAVLTLGLTSHSIPKSPQHPTRIDRKVVVKRHNVIVTQVDSMQSVSVGNGGLLMAVSMMCAGWDGYKGAPNPGFPKDGTWNVKWEGLKPMP